MDLHDKIAKLKALAAKPGTPAEKEAAERMLARLNAKLAERGETPDPGGRGMFERVYGEKYSGYLPGAELTRLIRADIALARKLGQKAAKPGDLKCADPIGDAPKQIRFYVRHESYSGGRSLYVTIKGVPAEWWGWEQPYYSDDPKDRFRAPGPRLQELADELFDICWAYNYDGTDAMIDYFDRNFYEHVQADGHGQGPYPRDINRSRVNR